MLKNNPFIKIPNNLIWILNTDTKEDSLMQQALKTLRDETMVSMLPEILTQLNWRVNRLGFCTFTLSGLIISCGYVPRTGDHNSINRFRSILNFLQYKNYITNVNFSKNDTFENIAPSSEVICILDNHFKQNKDGDTEFFTLTLKEYTEIFKKCTSSTLRRNILNVYFYLSARLPGNPFVKETNINDGLLHFCYLGQGELASILYISRSTAATCLNILSDLKLIYYGNIGKITGTTSKGTEGTICATTIYAKSYEGLNQGLSYSSSYYESKGYSAPNNSELKELAKAIISKGGKK